MEIREYYKIWKLENGQFDKDEKSLSMNEAIKLFRDFKYDYREKKGVFAEEKNREAEYDFSDYNK